MRWKWLRSSFSLERIVRVSCRICLLPGCRLWGCNYSNSDKNMLFVHNIVQPQLFCRFFFAVTFTWALGWSLSSACGGSRGVWGWLWFSCGVVHGGGDLVSILREFSFSVGGAFVLAGVGAFYLTSIYNFPITIEIWFLIRQC